MVIRRPTGKAHCVIRKWGSNTKGRGGGESLQVVEEWSHLLSWAFIGEQVCEVGTAISIVAEAPDLVTAPDAMPGIQALH